MLAKSSCIGLSCFLLRGKEERWGVYLPDYEEEVLEEWRRESALLCLKCGRMITSRDKEISLGGKHAHIFFNPQGILFELGCFSEAPGCVCMGPPTTEFSWFKGYGWEFALCGNCGEHLGWHYQPLLRSSGPADFFGLILKKICEGEAGGD